RTYINDPSNYTPGSMREAAALDSVATANGGGTWHQSTFDSSQCTNASGINQVTITSGLNGGGVIQPNCPNTHPFMYQRQRERWVFVAGFTLPINPSPFIALCCKTPPV